MAYRNFCLLVLGGTIFFIISKLKLPFLLSTKKREDPRSQNLFVSPNSNRIFFHETSGSKRLNLRQICAIESAAKHNSARPVQVFLHSGNDLADLKLRPWFEVLGNYSNIQISYLNETKYFHNTPLQYWYDQGEWQKSPYKVVHLSDYARMLSLYKGGGLYLDMDVITLRPLDTEKLWNFLVLEDKNSSIIPNSVMHFQYGHRFVDYIIRYLVEEYDPAQWVFHGPAITTAIMRDHCGFREFQKPATNTCEDVKLLPYETFFPIVPESYDLIYRKATNETLSLLKNSYGVHIWNSKSQYDFFDMRSNQLYATLARINCPVIAGIAAECSLE